MNRKLLNPSENLHPYDLWRLEHPTPVQPPRTPGKRTNYTANNKAKLDAGIHPATLLPVRLEGGTCGTCVHHQAYTWQSKMFHKCDIHRLGESHSEASDIRVHWPACTKYEAECTPKPN